MNTLELMQIIGRTAILAGKRNEFDTSVRITDAKMSYGRLLYQVVPISGTGSVWVKADRITIQEVNPCANS